MKIPQGGRGALSLSKFANRQARYISEKKEAEKRRNAMIISRYQKLAKRVEKARNSGADGNNNNNNIKQLPAANSITASDAYIRSDKQPKKMLRSDEDYENVSQQQQRKPINDDDEISDIEDEEIDMDDSDSDSDHDNNKLSKNNNNSRKQAKGKKVTLGEQEDDSDDDVRPNNKNSKKSSLKAKKEKRHAGGDKTKFNPYAKAKEAYEKKRQEELEMKKRIQEELALKRAAKEAKEAKRKETTQMLRKKNSRGQPVMKGRINNLLARIQQQQQ